MGRQLRKVDPGSLVEITCRVVQSRLLLRPSSMLNLLVAGIVARAQQRYEVQVCFVVVLGNHIHLLLVPADVEALSDFMEYVSSNISREVGRLVDWTGPLWSRRYVSIPCSSEPEIQLSRLEYMLSQGPKENLTWSPLDWPGVHSAWALMNGQPIPGLWIDRTGMYEAGRRGDKVKKADYTERLELRLSPLPCWADLDPLEYRRRVSEMVKTIEEETWERHRILGTKPMGAEKILAQSPYAKPTTTKISKAPRFHTATPEVWIAMMASYRDFTAAFRQAAQLLKDGVFDAKFPEGSFPPARPFVAHAARAPG